jgi:hypothetical protein
MTRPQRIRANLEGATNDQKMNVLIGCVDELYDIQHAIITKHQALLDQMKALNHELDELKEK